MHVTCSFYTRLVEALYPAKVTYPGTEWLIGNHADELVPW